MRHLIICRIGSFFIWLTASVFACAAVVLAAPSAFAEGVYAPGDPRPTFFDALYQDEEGANFSFPSTVAVDPNTREIYVIAGKGNVVVYDEDFFPLFTLDEKRGVVTPVALAFDAEGSVYIAQASTKDKPHRISVYNAAFRWVRDIYFTGFEGADKFLPNAIAIDSRGLLHVAHFFGSFIVVIDRNGKFIDKIEVEHDGQAMPFNFVTIDAEGLIYALSEMESKVFVFNRDKKVVRKFGDKGGSSGKLSRPMSLGVDNRTGTVYVIDYMRHAGNIYDKEGKHIGDFGGQGWAEGWFQYPRSITVDAQGRVYVADTFNNRVQRFKPPKLEVKPQEAQTEVQTSDKDMKPDAKSK